MPLKPNFRFTAKNMIGYFINMTLAAVVATGSYFTKWWLPAVVFPAWLLVSRVTPLGPGQMTVGRIYAMRWYFYFLATTYMIAQAVVFQIHIGSWFGWLLGLIIGWGADGMVAGKLEPKLLHRGIP